MGNVIHLPSDANALGAIAARPPSPEVKNAALQQLQPIVEGLARRVACQFGASVQSRRDLVAAAFGHIGTKVGQFDPTRGTPFEAWCRVLLQNHFIDLVEARNRNVLVRPGTFSIHPAGYSADDLAPPDPPFPDDLVARLESAIDERAPFGKDDMDELQTWTLKDRIVLLTVTGLWPKVPLAEWNDWVAGMDLDLPFPPERYATDGPLESLARDLDVPLANLARQYYRKLPLLSRLSYLKERFAKGFNQ